VEPQTFANRMKPTMQHKFDRSTLKQTKDELALVSDRVSSCSLFCYVTLYCYTARILMTSCSPSPRHAVSAYFNYPGDVLYSSLRHAFPMHYDYPDDIMVSSLRHAFPVSANDPGGVFSFLVSSPQRKHTLWRHVPLASRFRVTQRVASAPQVKPSTLITGTADV
jgi:hypothetical protein